MKLYIVRAILYGMTEKLLAAILLILALLFTASAVYYMKSQYELAQLQKRFADLARKGTQEAIQPAGSVTGAPQSLMSQN